MDVGAIAKPGCSSYCTFTEVGEANSESGFRKMTWPIS